MMIPHKTQKKPKKITRKISKRAKKKKKHTSRKYFMGIMHQECGEHKEEL